MAQASATPFPPALDSRVELVISGHNHHGFVADHFPEAAAGV
jgi:predicted MPP superfamily phosphohydrolase